MCLTVQWSHLNILALSIVCILPKDFSVSVRSHLLPIHTGIKLMPQFEPCQVSVKQLDHLEVILQCEADTVQFWNN